MISRCLGAPGGCCGGPVPGYTASPVRTGNQGLRRGICKCRSKRPLLNVTSNATQLAPLVTSLPRRCYCNARKAQLPVSRCSRPVQHCSSGVCPTGRVFYPFSYAARSWARRACRQRGSGRTPTASHLARFTLTPSQAEAPADSLIQCSTEGQPGRYLRNPRN